MSRNWARRASWSRRVRVTRRQSIRQTPITASVRQMMPLTLTDEQQAFVDAVRDFCKRECGTREQRDALTDGGKHPHNPDLYKKMADLGWLGISVPEEYGGSGGGLVDMCLFLEETAKGMAPVGGYGVSA